MRFGISATGFARLACVLALVTLAACQGVTPEALDVAQAAKPVTEERIGQGAVSVVLVASGPASQRQADIVDGARLAMADMGKDHVTLDIRTTSDAAAIASAKIVLGPMDAGAVAALDRATRPPVLAFTDTVPQGAGRAWRLYADEIDSAAEGARMVIEAGQTTLVIFHPEGFDTAAIKRLGKAIAARGGKVAATIAYPGNAAGVSAMVKSKQASLARAQSAVVLGAGEAGLGAVLDELATGAAGANLRSVIVSSAFPKSLHARPSAQGVILALPAPPALSRIAPAYKARFQREPSYDSAVGYDAVAIATGLARVSAGAEIRTDVLTNRTGFRGVTGLFRFGRDGDIERRHQIFRIENDMPKLLQVEGDGF